jgi:hypothetical protein
MEKTSIYKEPRFTWFVLYSSHAAKLTGIHASGEPKFCVRSMNRALLEFQWNPIKFDGNHMS